jgi:hypothetical protein
VWEGEGKGEGNLFLQKKKVYVCNGKNMCFLIRSHKFKSRGG